MTPIMIVALGVVIGFGFMFLPGRGRKVALGLLAAFLFTVWLMEVFRAITEREWLFAVCSGILALVFLRELHAFWRLMFEWWEDHRAASEHDPPAGGPNGTT